MSNNGASTSAPDIPALSTEIMPVEEPNNTQSNISIQNDATPNVNGKENEKPASGGVVDRRKEKKQFSAVAFLCHPFKSGKTIPDGNSNKGSSSNVQNRNHSEVDALLNMIDADLKVMVNARDRMKNCEIEINAVTEKIEELKKEKRENPGKFEKLKAESGSAEEFRKLKKDVKKLKLLISSKSKEENGETHRSLRAIATENINLANAGNALDEMPNLYKIAAFEQSLVFKEFETRYRELEDELKLCLLCFSVFPENMEIKKRMMIYWWIGEGFVPPIRRANAPVEQQNTNANAALLQQNRGENTAVLRQNTGETAVVQRQTSVRRANAALQQQNSGETAVVQPRNTSGSAVPQQQSTGENPSVQRQKTGENKAVPRQNTGENAVVQQQTTVRRANAAVQQQNTGESAVVQPRNTFGNAVGQQQNTVENAVVQMQPNSHEKTAEQFAKEFFKELIAKGFIEPVHKKRPGVNICKMHPFVRSMVIKLAMRANFFDFDEKGNVKAEYSESLRACLTGKGLTQIHDLEKLHAVFNVDEAILEFKPEWFVKMKNVNVLYLGRWQTSAAHHIEVEDTETLKKKNANVLDGLENIKHLRFLSLQGISRIMALPESISKLTNLTILDIRACHNLEVIPNGIGMLKKLTHLDMSECYLLDQMPKGLASLSELQVLSGFVVGEVSKGKNSCTLEDLQKLTKLRKLSIHTGVNEFPSEKDLCALHQFKVLSKLTIAWGRRSEQAKRDGTGNQDNSGGMAGTLNRENGEGNKKEGNSAAEHATAVAEELDLPRDLPSSSTSKQSAGMPDRENGNGSKKKVNFAAEHATTVAKESDISRSLTRPSTSKQLAGTPNREDGEGSQKKGKSAAEHAAAAAKEPDLLRAPTRPSTSKQPAGTLKRENGEGSKKKDTGVAKQPKSPGKKSLLQRATTFPSNPTSEEPHPELPSQLIKLDLQCFPGIITPSWLRACKLQRLEKLYIRGGKFADLGQFQDLDGKEGTEKDKWKVVDLRLKYLTELEMDWRELQELFPKLNYLEKVECPKLTFFPCDESGVWVYKKNNEAVTRNGIKNTHGLFSSPPK